MGAISGEEPNIRRLIALAEAARNSEAAGIDPFLAAVGEYLNALEEWRARIEPVADGEADAETKAALEELNEVHLRLVATGDRLRGGIVQEMGESQKKAGALRAYVDRLPQRITIAGKRKG